MKAFLLTSHEYQDWGWNTTTIAAIATIFFTMTQIWGLWNQIVVIWKNKSAKSVSAALFSYGCFYSLSFIIYAVHNHSVTMVISGLQGIAYVPIVIGICVFKKLAKYEIAMLFICPLMIPAMWLVDNDKMNMLLAVLTFITFPVLVATPWEIWKNKSAGSVSLRLLFVYLASSSFWTIYALSIHNWVLALYNPVGIIILLVTLALWFKFRVPQVKS